MSLVELLQKYVYTAVMNYLPSLAQLANLRFYVHPPLRLAKPQLRDLKSDHPCFPIKAAVSSGFPQ